MKVLVACEESQAVCTAFREREVTKPTLVISGNRQADTLNGTLKWTLYCYSDGIWFSKPKTEKLIMLSGGI